MDDTTISLHEFAWSTLTDNQKYRINMMYELKKKIDCIEPGKTKRSIYRLIAEQFPGFSVSRIEYISSHELK